MGKTMLPSEVDVKGSRDTKLQTAPKLPSAEVMRAFTDDDSKVLKSTLEETIEYIPHAFLDSPTAERVFLAPRDGDCVEASADDSGMYRLEIHEQLPPETTEEQQAFLRLNFFRRRLLEVLSGSQGRRLSAKIAHEALIWARMVREIRGQLVRDNMPLVLAMAKRTRITGVDPSDLISEGNLALLRAVNKFDCSRGYRFSTYACRAILKSFSRVAARTSRYRGHFPTEFDPLLEKSDFLEQRRQDVEANCVSELRDILSGKLGNLSDVERQVIQARFAIDPEELATEPRKGKTLEQVGELIGVTKERVRQIQNKALGKLKAMLDRSALS